MENNSTCELANTYEILEYIMGINGLHPHSLRTIDTIFNIIAEHTKNQKGIVLDVGCGSGAGTYSLSKKVSKNVSVIGIDINEFSIKKARTKFSGINNLSFYHGTQEDYRQENPKSKIIGITSISVSMFLPNIEIFYETSQNILTDGGIFVDAPFVFRDLPLSDNFKLKTYSICGCNMTMHTTKHLQTQLLKAGFNDVKSELKEFELMNLKILFNEYSPRLLFYNFFKNIVTPPKVLKTKSSTYLFKRTLKIFRFFLKNKGCFGAGIIIGLKKSV